MVTPDRFNRHSSFAQPNGSRRPDRSRIASFRLGRHRPKAAGLPSTSANQTSRSCSSGRSALAVCATSSGVIGTNPQLPFHASLKIEASEAMSASIDARRSGRSVTPAGRPRATMAAAAGGRAAELSQR